jgi:ATP/maltotriose-dependent transcriptional regulator MalT
MQTIRAKLKNNTITFVDKIKLPKNSEHLVLITFLDGNEPIFEDLTRHEAIRTININRYNLVKRELQILNLVRSGMSNAKIANKLGISVGRVRNSLWICYRKLGVANRTGAILRATELELLDL